MSKTRVRWALLVVFNVVLVCVLSFYRSGNAAYQPGKQPFKNPVTQRQEMIRELSGIRALLQEQNQLLRSIYKQNAKTKTSNK